MSPGPDHQPPGRDMGKRRRSRGRSAHAPSRFDRFVLMMERVGRSLWIAVVVVGVALGSLAAFVIVNKPDDTEATALLAALDQGPVPVAAHAPRDWTHVCLGEAGMDGRALMREVGGLEVQACSGWNQSFVFYDSYAALAFAAPTTCHIIAVNADLFVPARKGQAQCIARRGLMMLEFDGQGAARRLTVKRR